MKIGSTVRIEKDEFSELVGVVGTIERISSDGTVAWVAPAGPSLGVWCSIDHLVEVTP